MTLNRYTVARLVKLLNLSSLRPPLFIISNVAVVPSRSGLITPLYIRVYSLKNHHRGSQSRWVNPEQRSNPVPRSRITLSDPVFPNKQIFPVDFEIDACVNPN